LGWKNGWRTDATEVKVLGNVAKMTKTKAREKMARNVKPITTCAEAISPNVTVEDFVEKVYLPFLSTEVENVHGK